MINTNYVKSILAFYLNVRLTRWGIPTDERLQLPTDAKKLDKIKLICKLYYNLNNHAQDKKFLLAYCDKLEAIEKTERETHHSRFAPSISDYPFMSCTIRAIRSHIMNAVSPEKEINPVQAYLNSGEFLNVIKYEDYHYTGSKFQQINTISEFTEACKKDANLFGLLDRIYLLNTQVKYPKIFASETHISQKAVEVIEKPTSSNKQRSNHVPTLFAAVANAKAAAKKEKEQATVVAAAGMK